MNIEVEVRGFTRPYGRRVNEIITECGVSLPFDPRKGERPKQIIKTAALWDTGATNSVITKELAQKLQLKPIREVDSHHAGGKTRVNVYLVNIILPNNRGVSYVQVSECEDTVGRFGVLIGMDIITRGDFAISNLNGNTTVSFRMPSVHEIRLERDCIPANPMQTENHPVESSKAAPKMGRNDPCHCGSGKKYKHCHGKGK